MDPVFSLSNGLNLNEGDVPRCAEVSPDIFFPEEVEDENGKLISSTYVYESEAKAVCVSCDLRLKCLAAALKTSDVGIWGGTTERERRRIKREKMNPGTYQVRFRKAAISQPKSSRIS